MTIIASSIKQRQLIMNFFSDLYTDSLGRRSVFRDITKMLLNTTANNTIYSSYKSCAQMLKANKINPKDNNYTEAFTAMKKLGIIFKHNNCYCLNPAVKANYTSRRYQLTVEYYNFLFKDTSFELTTLDELRTLAVSNYLNKLEVKNQLIEENNYLYEKFGSPRHDYIQPLRLKSFNTYYDIAFNTSKPNSLSSFDKPIWKAVNEAYRNVCDNYTTCLLIHHIHILEEQGLVSIQWGGPGTKTNFKFNRFTLKLQKTLIAFEQTKYYLDNLPVPHEQLALQLFADTHQQIQLESEEEEDLNEEMNSSFSDDYHDFITELEVRAEAKIKAQAKLQAQQMVQDMIAQEKRNQELLNTTDHHYQFSNEPPSVVLDRTQLPKDHPDYCPF